MKKLILLLFIPLVFACGDDEEISGINGDEINSQVSEIEISDIYFTSVNLFATYENEYNGDDMTTEKGFEISYNENFSLGLSVINSFSSELTIEVELTNLDATTQYYVRAFVTNEYGTNYGPVTSFSTLDASSEFTTIIISEIGFDTATFSSTYQNLYEFEDLTIDRGFVIGEHPDFYGQQILNANEDGFNINYTASNLEADTTYFVRAFVTNQYGTTFSDSISFKTDTQPEAWSCIELRIGGYYADDGSNIIILPNEIDNRFDWGQEEQGEIVIYGFVTQNDCELDFTDTWGNWILSLTDEGDILSEDGSTIYYYVN